jgi:hypothetical protein
MARRSIHHLYDRYRSNPSLESGNTKGSAFNKNTNQDPESKYDAGYHNDVPGDWRRGGGAGGATSKPGFDRGNAWRAGRDGVDHGQGDPATIRKPEPNK